jgi:hypothetical protein
VDAGFLRGCLRDFGPGGVPFFCQSISGWVLPAIGGLVGVRAFNRGRLQDIVPGGVPFFVSRFLDAFCPRSKTGG